MRKGEKNRIDHGRYILARLSRKATAFMRVLPEFLIIGAAKSGTTSLYNYLVQHPQVAPAFRKEVHYFDRNYDKGINWYRSFFPVKRSADQNHRVITGESSPYYLSHPLAPKRISSDLPGIRLFCILRNPIDRAVSNYNHRVRLGIEKLPIGEAFEMEQQRIRGEEDRLSNEPGYFSFNHYHFSYLSRGYYAKLLKRWFRHFDKEDILIIQSEQLYKSSEEEYRRALDHLGLDYPENISFRVFNSGGSKYDQLPQNVRRNLEEHFRPHNQQLYELIGREFDW